MTIRPPAARPRALFAGALAATLTVALAAAPASAGIVDEPVATFVGTLPFDLVPVGSYETGIFDESAAEITAYVPGAKRVLTINAQAGEVDVLDVSNPTRPTKLTSMSAAGATDVAGGTLPTGAVANSVSVRSDGLAAIAIEAPTKTDPGWVLFVDAAAATPRVLGAVRVGAQPDMVAISPDGKYAVSADEGEPNDDYTVDPEGSVSVITLPAVGTVAAPAAGSVRTADFRAYDAGTATLKDGVRIFAGIEGSEFPIAENLEPEFVAIHGSTAYVTLQENNAIATVDLATATVTDVMPLGFKDHGVKGNGLDASDRDDAINITTYPGLYGMYQPDGIATFTGADGKTYLITANEGDAREWGDFVEVERVSALGTDGLAPVCEDSPLATQTGNADLGRLEVSIVEGLNEAGTCYEALYVPGGRSIAVWTTDGELVAETGEALEVMTAEVLPEYFNSNHVDTSFDSRSDAKGPEPENLAVGVVDGRTYAFVGLERIGGIAVFDVTDAADPAKGADLVGYVNNRDFSVSVRDSADIPAALAQAGDLGPEGVTFVAADVSPTGRPMLAVGNEVSGTTTLFDFQPPAPPTVYLASSWTTPVADLELVLHLAGGDVLVGDFDGDGIDELGVRHGNHFLLYTAEGTIEFTFGRAGDQVVVGDWDGDGTDTIAVRRGNRFFVDNTFSGGEASFAVDYGRVGDEIYAGDWNGDGTDTPAVRRGNTLHLAKDLAGGQAERTLTYGRAGEKVYIGDFDGNGVDTYAVRRGNSFLYTDDPAGGVSSTAVPFGRTTDVAFVGTWFQDTADTPGVYRPMNDAPPVVVVTR